MVGNKGRSLIWYLQRYYKIQPNIELVYRPTLKDTWALRHRYLSDKFDPRIQYNHRSIIHNEIVCEYDNDNKKLNRECSEKVAKKLTELNISWTLWYSGNKSYHLHFFIDTKEAKRPHLLKSAFLITYGTFEEARPDLRLCSSNHLVRAEYGIHEKTGFRKTLIKSNGEFMKEGRVPEEVWEEYAKKVKAILTAKITNTFNDLKELRGFKYIINSEQFRASDDGRERAMFMLIHLLKSNYRKNKKELVKFLQDWYKYSGGTKLSDWAIECKVNYHWNKEYKFTENYLNNLLYEIGREDLIESIKKET